VVALPGFVEDAVAHIEDLSDLDAIDDALDRRQRVRGG
jgi:hypothetical protein